jgi:hypothetical protein
MYVERHTITLTTDANGVGVGYTDAPVTGKIVGISYAPDTTAPLSSGFGLTVQCEQSKELVLAKSGISAGFDAAPRKQCHLNSSAAAISAYDCVRAAAERLKATVAAGGAAAVGTFTVLVE